MLIFKSFYVLKPGLNPVPTVFQAVTITGHLKLCFILISVHMYCLHSGQIISRFRLSAVEGHIYKRIEWFQNDLYTELIAEAKLSAGLDFLLLKATFTSESSGFKMIYTLS